MGFQNTLVASLAVVVSGIIIFILWSVTIQSQERSVTATQQRSVRTSSVDFIAMMEFDFQNIGSNYPDFENDPEYAITTYDTASATKQFRFVGQTERGMAPDTVLYQWSKTGTKEIIRERTTVTADVYEIRRYVNGSLAGTSSANVTRFEVGLLDSAGQPVATTSEARQVRVGVSMISNLGANSLGETHWNSIIRPTALARNDYLDYIEV